MGTVGKGEWALATRGLEQAKIDSSRLLAPHLFKNLIFHETSAGVVFGTFPGPQDGTQNDPKSTQDGSKIIFKNFFFRLCFFLASI